MVELSKLELEAKILIVSECKEHYNAGGCFTRCRCRINGKCAGTTKENKWNVDLIDTLKPINERENLINNLERGDIVLIKSGSDWNTLATVINTYDLVIEFKDSSGLFDFTKKYLINSDLELELIEEL